LGWKPEPGCSDCADHAAAAIPPAATIARTAVTIAFLIASSHGFLLPRK
jgi:hypothetical protein